jgi:hypothetical protein
VRIYEDVKDDLQWRTGVVLENKDFNSLAVIKSDNETKRIYINVNGGQKRDYFSSILFDLREINRSFKRLKALEKENKVDKPRRGYFHQVFISLSICFYEKAGRLRRPVRARGYKNRFYPAILA